MKKRDIDFEQWKKQKLYEGFLDGEEEKPATSDDAAPAEETSEEETTEEAPAEEEPAPEDTDVSEEGGDEEATEDDGLDDDFEGETKEETGVEDGDDSQINELKDAIATLTAQIQTLTDQMKKETGDGGEEGEGGEEAPAEETTEETAEPEEGEEGGEGEESSEETSEEGGEEGGEETSEESSEETTDETKSEAYNHFHKKGGILAENSGYLISYLNEGRFDKLEEKIMAVVHAKIRQKIDAAKTKLKTEAFNKKFGK